MSRRPARADCTPARTNGQPPTTIAPAKSAVTSGLCPPEKARTLPVTQSAAASSTHCRRLIAPPGERVDRCATGTGLRRRLVPGAGHRLRDLVCRQVDTRPGHDRQRGRAEVHPGGIDARHRPHHPLHARRAVGAVHPGDAETERGGRQRRNGVTEGLDAGDDPRAIEQRGIDLDPRVAGSEADRGITHAGRGPQSGGQRLGTDRAVEPGDRESERRFARA